MYELYRFQDFNKDQFFEFLKFESENSLDPASKNMWDDSNYSLPYLLENTDRFIPPNGEFNILTYKGNIIACAGVYISVFSNKVALAGTRAWVTSKFRNKHILREYLLPSHKLWAINQGCGIIAICFNDYNKNLTKVFTRTRLGESSNRVNYKEPKHLFYNGINELDYPVNIQYTKQYVLYEVLDPSFRFDWGSIKYEH